MSASTAAGPGRSKAERLGLRAAPWALWFAVLSGGFAWSAHTVVGWGLDETVCRSGHNEVQGVPLRPLIGGFTLVMLVVAGLALAVAWRLRRRLLATSPDDPVQALRAGRAHFMSVVALGANVLFVLIIVLGGIAVLVFGPCAR